MKIQINGRTVVAFRGESVLTAATRAGIAIPTLCHHEAVEDSGACRLCMVEIRKAGWDEDWTQLVTACLFPVEEDLVVLTGSPEVRQTRKEILELLLARAPEAEAVQALAAAYGIDGSPYPPQEEAALPNCIPNGHKFRTSGASPAQLNCILCGLCTRICQTLVTGAIATAGRGPEKVVGTPFGEATDVCIGCLACASSCPTGAIPVEDTGASRTIWGRSFALAPCTTCGAPTATRPQIDWLAQKTGRAPEDFMICVACKTKATGEAYHRISW
ncbi:MAG: 2Fe-2S iron-sulfur cluster-binding protein [Pseudomonadota bacterium]